MSGYNFKPKHEYTRETWPKMKLIPPPRSEEVSSYRVVFVDMANQEKSVFDFEDLWSALQVAKNTLIEGRSAISNYLFEDGLLRLLLKGYLTIEEINHIVMVLKVNPSGEESPVYSKDDVYDEYIPR